MKLSIVIISYKQIDLLDRCLSSIRLWNEIKDSEIIVIDNASNDPQIKLLETRYQEVHFEYLKENIGFGRANNLAVSSFCKGNYLLFLNSDAELIEPALETLLAFMETNTDVAIIGPRLLNSDQSIQPSTHGYPTLLKEIGRLFPSLKKLLENNITVGKIGTFFGRQLRIKVFSRFISLENNPVLVDELTGACFLMRKDIFNLVNGFDPNYFMYLEEADLCLKVRKQGLKIVLIPLVRVKHKLSASAAQFQKNYNQLRMLSLQYFYRKWYGSFALTRLNFLMSVILIMKLPWMISVSLISKKAQSQLKEEIQLLCFLLKQLPKPACKSTH